MRACLVWELQLGCSMYRVWFGWVLLQKLDKYRIIVVLRTYQARLGAARNSASFISVYRLLKVRSHCERHARQAR